MTPEERAIGVALELGQAADRFIAEFVRVSQKYDLATLMPREYEDMKRAFDDMSRMAARLTRLAGSHPV